MFSFNSTSITRGHSYKLFGKTSRVNIRHQFFCNRVVNIWNNLPATDVNFKSFRAFKTFLSNIDLSAYLRKCDAYQSDAPWCQLKPFRIILLVVVLALIYFINCSNWFY